MAIQPINNTARIYGATHEPTPLIVNELAEAIKWGKWDKINALLLGANLGQIKKYDEALSNRGSWIPTRCLYKVAERGHLDLARLFIQLDPDVLTNPNIDAINPLQNAICEDRTDIVEFILQYNPNLITSVDEEGSTLLHHAAKWGSNKAAKVILNRDPTRRTISNNNNRTPLMTAIKEGHKETVRLFASSESIEGLKKASEFAALVIDDLASKISDGENTDPFAIQEYSLKRSKEISFIISIFLSFKLLGCELTAARDARSPASPLKRLVAHSLYEPRVLGIIKDFLLQK
jgi:ankyrin repeat protein